MSGNIVHLQTPKRIPVKLVKCKHEITIMERENTNENASNERWTRLRRYTQAGRLPSKERGIG